MRGCVSVAFFRTHSCQIKGTRCLGSVELVFEKRPVTVCYKIDMVRKML